MENIKAEIKSVVLVLDESIEDNAKLDLMIELVIDKFLSFARREEVPDEAVNILAQGVVNQYAGGFIVNMKDNQQAVTFKADVLSDVVEAWKPFQKVKVYEGLK